MLSRWKAIRRRRKERRRKAAKTRRTRFGITVVVRESGPPCPRCKQTTEVREHKKSGKGQRQAKFYFARWYRCTNRQCKTTLIMPEEFKVWNWGSTRFGLSDSRSRAGSTPRRSGHPNPHHPAVAEFRKWLSRVFQQDE